MANSVVITGNIGREPECRQTASGTSVLSFTVAVNERRKNSQTGEWDNYTNWVDVAMFGNRAASLSQMLHKGMKVCVQGRLRYSQWERDGQKRSKLDVLADEIDFMSPKQQPRQQSGYQGDAQYVQAETYETPQQGGYYDDDCPFN